MFKENKGIDANLSSSKKRIKISIHTNLANFYVLYWRK